MKSQSLSRHPVSTEAEIGYSPCRDTLKILKHEEEYDIGVILPSWPPIVNDDYVAVVEGMVSCDPDGRFGPHVSHEDLPFYHYTHDLDFDVIPDKTADNRFTNLLPLLVYKREEGQSDTALRRTLAIEWESGLGAGNVGNPLRKMNEKGRSNRFFSAGHECGDVIWNWPTCGDWVHVEGHYVWDRGHPPANAEIHPARLVVTKRNLPEKIFLQNEPARFATRVDIFGSGDGGALRNNRFDVKKFIKRVAMSSKDYTFRIQIDLPKPSAQAQLKVFSIKRKGDTFSALEEINIVSDSSFVDVILPWHSKSMADSAVFARTLYVYWNEGEGVSSDYPIDEYEVTLQNLNFKKRFEIYGASEMRVFSNIGSDWLFINDFLGKKGNILNKGIGKTYQKDWNLANKITVYVPREKQFRVFMGGWEKDGVDFFMGDLLDPSSECNHKTKRIFKAKLFSIKHMFIGGCKDDELGQIANLHSFSKLSNQNFFKNAPKDGVNDDPCPFSHWQLKNTYFLSYSIFKK